MKIWLNEIHNDIIDEAETKWLQLLYHLYGVLEDRGTDRSTDSPPPLFLKEKYWEGNNKCYCDKRDVIYGWRYVILSMCWQTRYHQSV